MIDGRVILCFGDSNTHGTLPMRDLDDRRRLGPRARWPGILAAAIGPGWQIVEEGLPGRTTVHEDPIEGRHKNGLPGLFVALETHLPIALVVLMLGTNDLKARFSLEAEDIAESVGLLLRMIRASDAGLDGRPPAALLVAPPPIVETGSLAGFFRGGAEKSERFGALYADVARREDALFLDAGSVIRSSPLDGIHFDAAEHERLGEAVATTLRSWLLSGWNP